MSCPVNVIFTVGREMALGENWIAGSRDVWAFYAVAHKDYLAMVSTRTTFGAHQVILSIFLINVRSFYPYWFEGKINATIYDNLIGAWYHLVFLQVVFPHFNYPVPVIKLLA